jgi:hypothetical protein
MGKYKKIYEILKCPVDIPLNDLEAWTKYPKYRWVYNKMNICRFQKIKHAPMPISPKKYPVIIKPIINMYGMGLNIIRVDDEDEFYDEWQNSNFWMEYFKGEHLSYDIILLKGDIQFHTCFIGHRYKNGYVGQFDYWESVNRKIPDIIKKLIKKKLKNYSGCINVETVDKKIIECHLRMGDIDQFPTLDLLKGVIATYQKKKYDWDKIKLDKIYFFPIWSDIKNDHIYNYLEKEISPLLENNKNIYDFKIDSPDLATPCHMKRIMWFTCNDKSYGKEVRKGIGKRIHLDLIGM